MNTPNPLIPQGTFPDSRGRSHFRLAVFAILAVHVVLLGGLLMLGCRKPAVDDTAQGGSNVSNPPTPIAPIFEPPTNPVVPPPSNPPPSNVVVQPPTNRISDFVPPAPPQAETEHVVVKGDSFYTLSKKYGVKSSAIADSNPGVNSTKLKIGQKLKIPAAATAAPGAALRPLSEGAGPAPAAEKVYTVKSGDNLLKIAKANGIGVKALRSANALKTDQIKVGQKLKIPGKAPVAAAPESVLTPTPPTATSSAPVTLPPP